MNASPSDRIFGPVPSRRLGRSLGVDLIPYKTCSFDCVYCQIGRTTCKTIERRAFLPHEPLLDALRAKLEHGPRPDIITLSGSGEPTLDADFGAFIAEVKRFTDIPVAVLTNGSLLYDPAVRADCARADLVLPSLDAGDEDVYQRINRPHEALPFQKVVDGLAAFREEFAGDIWLEVFFIEGLNTDAEQVDKIRSWTERIRPDKVHLNTAVRPTAEASAVRVAQDRLESIAERLGPRAEVIADFSHVHEQADFQAQRDDVLAMLQRRPCSLDDIASGLGLHRNHVLKFIEELEEKQLIQQQRRGDVIYYLARS